MCIDQGFIQILQYQNMTKWVLKMGITFFCWKHKASDKYTLGLRVLILKEYCYFQILVTKVPPQVSVTDASIFIMWNGNMMVSGVIIFNLDRLALSDALIKLFCVMNKK